MSAVANGPRWLRVRHLPGLQDYRATWEAMRDFTDRRGPDSRDELWVLEHPPVFTLGQAGRTEHLRAPGAIPVIATDRGGQVTYHGPGQIVLYVLLDIRRAGMGVKRLVGRLEQAVIDALAGFGVSAERRADAPGVYVEGAKIASLGLRIRNGCSYHGLALNISMDLEPFSRIDPCGYPGLAVTRLVDLAPGVTLDQAKSALIPATAAALGCTLDPAETRLHPGV